MMQFPSDTDIAGDSLYSNNYVDQNNYLCYVSTFFFKYTISYRAEVVQNYVIS